MKIENIFRLVISLMIVTGMIVVFIYRDQIDEQTLQRWLGDGTIAAGLIFMLIYIFSTVLFVPGSVMTLAGGALFGPVWGTFYNLTGATLGAVAAFLVSRYVASDWVRTRAGNRLQMLMKGVEDEGWRFVAFTRLVPLFPFFLLNYALGLTRISLREYTVASYIFMFPGAVAWTYLGYVGREVATGEEDLIQKILLALALLAVVMFLPRFVKRLRNKPDPGQ